MTDRNAVDIAVIIPCYNQGRFLAETIESVLAQTRPAREIVVVDDGSTDDTVAVARRYAPRVQLISKPNGGVSQARNVGLAATTSAALVFLDADDQLLPEALAVNGAHVDREPELSFAAGHFRYLAENRTHAVPALAAPLGNLYPAFLSRNQIACPGAVLFRRSALLAVGGFDERLSGSADYDIYLRLSRRFSALVHSTEVIAYRRHAESMSQRSALMLRGVLDVLNAQETFVREHGGALVSAYRRGQYRWRNLYGRELLLDIGMALRTGQIRRAWNNLRALAPHLPMMLRWQIVKRFAAGATERAELLTGH